MFIINDSRSALTYDLIAPSDCLSITGANLEPGAITSINISGKAKVSAVELNMSVSNLSTDGVRITSSDMTSQPNFTSDNTCLWQYEEGLVSDSWEKVVGSENCDPGMVCVESSTVNMQYITGNDGQYIYVKCVPFTRIDEDSN